MKKFMKALAFATVMCLLLSTVAFAAQSPAASLDQTTDYKFTVTVTTDSDTQEEVSLLVVKHDAVLASLTSDQILYVGQATSSDKTATFADVVVDSSELEVDKVDIYAGYASANGPAVCYDDFAVVNARELAITLVTAEIINDVTTWEELDEAKKAAIADKLPEREIATMVRAKVDFANAANKTIDRVGWEFETSAGMRYAEYTTEGYGVLNGEALIGVTFANGWKADLADKEGYKPHVPITGVNLFFRVDGNEVQAAE